jgi:hypothetical protein
MHEAYIILGSSGHSISQNGLAAYDIPSTIKISAVPQQQHSMFVALCCWQLWKRRNDAIFHDEMLSQPVAAGEIKPTT